MMQTQLSRSWTKKTQQIPPMFFHTSVSEAGRGDGVSCEKMRSGSHQSLSHRGVNISYLWVIEQMDGSRLEK